VKSEQEMEYQSLEGKYLGRECERHPIFNHQDKDLKEERSEITLNQVALQTHRR
jgi:hypothetical protein